MEDKPTTNDNRLPSNNSMSGRSVQSRGPRSSRRSKKKGGGALKGCGGMFGAFAALVLMFGGGVILGHRQLRAAGALRATFFMVQLYVLAG